MKSRCYICGKWFGDAIAHAEAKHAKPRYAGLLAKMREDAATVAVLRRSPAYQALKKQVGRLEGLAANRKHNGQLSEAFHLRCEAEAVRLEMRVARALAIAPTAGEA